MENRVFSMDRFVSFILLLNQIYYLHLSFIGLTIIAFIGGEYWYNYRNGSFSHGKGDLENKQRRIHEKIPADIYEKLPVVTWDVSKI